MKANGYTLIEIMVALLIFSLVLLPLTGLLVAESRFSRAYQNRQIAMLVARNELEKAKRSCTVPEPDEYAVNMAGRRWNVALLVEQPDAGAGEVPEEATALRGVKPDSASEKQAVRVVVTKENDTSVLASFRVLRETYR